MKAAICERREMGGLDMGAPCKNLLLSRLRAEVNSQAPLGSMVKRNHNPATRAAQN
jgi:hypothetical protein